MSGATHPASRRRFTISGTAFAASGTFTVTRSISEPACASSRHCATVDATSAVSVLFIDWTTTGAPPPTRTSPTFTPIVGRRSGAIDLDVLDHVEVEDRDHDEDEEDEPRLQEALLHLQREVAAR